MDKKFVIDGATLECDYGSNKSTFKVTKFHGVLVKGKNQANVSDNKTDENIFSFKNCKKVGVCKPVIEMKWLKGKSNFSLNGEALLMEDCIISCTQGGVIKIKNCGQD